MLGVRNTIPHIAAIAVIAACIWLAQWQLERAAQKRVILDKWNNQAPVELATVTRPFDLPQPVTGVGIWDPDHQILLDNRIRDQRPGVQVLTPFRLPDGRIFLVNRGWASWPSRSDELPDPAITNTRGDAGPNIPGDILGVLNNPPGTGVRLGQSEYAATGAGRFWRPISTSPRWPGFSAKTFNRQSSSSTRTIMRT